VKEGNHRQWHQSWVGKTGCDMPSNIPNRGMSTKFLSLGGWMRHTLSNHGVLGACGVNPPLYLKDVLVGSPQLLCHYLAGTDQTYP